MPFSSGAYSLVAGNPVTTGTTISSTWANNTLNDIATALSTCVLKDGTQVATASIPFGTGLSAGTYFVVDASGNLAVTTNKFQITASNGNTVIAGTLNLTGAATFSSTLNKVTITPPASSATLTIADGGSLVTAGAFSITLTATAGTSVTLPTSGTLITSASLPAVATATELVAGSDNAKIATALALSGWIKSGRATADQSVDSGGTGTTLTNLTNMVFPIAASEEWIADFDLDIGDTLATTGIKIALTVPTSATMNLIVGAIPSVMNAGAVYAQRTTTSGTALDFTAAGPWATGNTIGKLRCSVWVLNSTNAGNVQLQFAQSSSSATALISRKGSHFVAHRKA